VWVAEVCNAGVKNGKIQEGWSKSWLASVDKETLWNMARTEALKYCNMY